MFESRKPRSGVRGAASLLTLIYHSTVRNIRRSHGNALIGLIMNIMQTVMFVTVFYIMFSVLGMKGNAIRGDFLLYIMSGIFLFMTHNKAMGAVVGSEGPTSPMMKHAPMNTIVAISAAALSALYVQILSMTVVLFVYHVAFTPIEIENPAAAMGMVLLSWFSGAAIGMIFLAVKPWFPTFTGIASTIYQRANMIASGKMFVANTLPGYMLAMFDWNPLFHTIDQNRGFIFINYNPHFSSVSYPVYVSLALLMLGLMGEFYTRKHASISWSSGQ
ncbi:MAG: ABC transporter permease [Confluentimicrobium sp.]|uniref:ABC transporter permease n=1 Tax=Actibacterium sp. TaxID=1872125 RepID=UPI00050DD645|nr:ABC transporter permease [Actibacterium sp.]KGB83702.1 ABC transporter permease [Rhodovulum sp. NI22]MBC57025.1 ABC transporter permease [Actibacterium sp.]MDY6858457.1 ABC transporter permease [Pseudomonadota bacterium]